MSDETKFKVANAFRAMKGLGISVEKVKPVLKNLLKVFKKNWKPIEEENYRALADAIFEQDEAEAAVQPKQTVNRNDCLEEESQDTGDLERPLKRLRDRKRNDQASASNAVQLMVLKTQEESSKLPDTHAQKVNGFQGVVESRQPSIEYERDCSPCNGLDDSQQNTISGAEATPPPYRMKLRDRGNRSESSQPKKRSVPKISPDGVHCNGLIKPKDEPVTEDIQDLKHHAAAVLPSCSNIDLDHGENRGPQEDGGEGMNGSSIMDVRRSHKAPKRSRSLHDKTDIAKGLEKVEISILNEVNDEHPPSFFYIPQNAVFQNAYLNFSLARMGDRHCCSGCVGDCLSLPLSCACANETGGEFAYTIDGLVKEEFLNECISMNRDPKKHCQFFCQECVLERSKNEDAIEPCKGHLVRKFIKECWLKCGCNKQCGNRVVQRGITRKLQVFMTSEGKGWGLRTLEDLPKGAFVCEYVGEVLTNAELFERVQHGPKGEKHSYPVLLDADWGAEEVLKDEEALCLDATYYGNVARFINHKCYDSNMVEIPVEVETPDHHYYHLSFFTTRNVKAFEELTWDYGIDFEDHNHPIKAFQCQCGSKFCRNIKQRQTRSRSRR